AGLVALGLRRQLRSPGADEALGRLAASPHLSRLAALDLGGNTFDREGLAALARSSALPRLASLAPQPCGLDQDALGGLDKGGASLRLTTLNLAENPLGEEGAHALARSPLCAHLRSLCLRHTNLYANEVTCLSSANFARLHALDLSDNLIGYDRI